MAQFVDGFLFRRVGVIWGSANNHFYRVFVQSVKERVEQSTGHCFCSSLFPFFNGWCVTLFGEEQQGVGFEDVVLVDIYSNLTIN